MATRIGRYERAQETTTPTVDVTITGITHVNKPDIEEYRQFVYRILGMAFAAHTLNRPEVKEARLLMVSESAMAQWQRARTHVSYDPNNARNSEMPEYLGDKTLLLSFAADAIAGRASITAGELTLLEQGALWKEALANLCDTIGLSQYILTLWGLTRTTKEDAMEAFIGEMLLIGDRLLGVGNGYALCKNLIGNLYGITSTATLDLNDIKNSKIKLKEIIETLRWHGKERANVSVLGEPVEENGGWRVTYTVPPKGLEWLQKYKRLNPSVDRIVLANVWKHYKHQALDDAADEAIHYLDTKWGITSASVAALARRWRPTLPAPVERMCVAEGYATVRLERPKDEDEANRDYWQLVGVKSADDASPSILTILITFKSKVPLDKKAQLSIAYEVYARDGSYAHNDVVHV